MSVESPNRPTPAPVVQTPRRFLIVEDNDDAREMLQTLLEAAGYLAAVACDGAEAFDIITRTPVDVVLCDIGLPRMNGYQFAEAVAQLPELGHVRLVAISGYALDSDRRRSAKAGFEAHLAKPVSLRQIEEVVARLLARDPGQ